MKLINKSILLVGMLIFCMNSISQTELKKDSCNESCHKHHLNMIPVGMMNSHVHKKNTWMVTYRYMGMESLSPISGTNNVSEMDVYKSYMSYTSNMNMGMHMLMGMYGITDRLTTMVMLNYNSNSMDMKMRQMQMADMSGITMNTTTTDMSMKTSGFGDSKVYLIYKLSEKSHSQLLINAGVNIPTGTIQIKGAANNMLYPNLRYPYMMQLGSGTIDVLPGLTYIYQKHKFAFSTQFSSVIRTNTNSVGYKYGNVFNLNIWGAYNWWNNFSSSFRLLGSNTEAIKGFDPTFNKYNEIAANPSNYGGNRITGYIGTVYQFKSGILKKIKLGVEYGIPLYQNVNGIQNQFKQSIVASLSRSF